MVWVVEVSWAIGKEEWSWEVLGLAVPSVTFIIYIE